MLITLIIIIDKDGSKSIFIKFIYGNNNGFINVKENQNFNDITKILERKYKWIKPIDKKKFYFSKDQKKIPIKMESTIKSLNISDNISINIE